MAKIANGLILLLCYILIIITLPISLFFCYKVIKEYERLIIIRLGNLLPGHPKGPGLVFVLPCADTYFLIDLRVISLDVPTQEALTKDAVSVQVDAVVYYRISNPLLAVLVVHNYHEATYLLAMTMLRNIIGSKSLSDILAHRQELQRQLQIQLDEATDPWGVIIERVEIKDVRIPSAMQRAMAAEAQAVQEARAKLISAEGEMNSAKSLQEAAQIISKSPGALQLKYLHTLNAISTEKNRLIIFPLPTHIMDKIM